jgi:hypothetical protein
MLTWQNENNQYSKVDIFSYGGRAWIFNVQANNSFHVGGEGVRDGGWCLIYTQPLLI